MARRSAAHLSAEHFDDYDGLQFAKHRLLVEYLKAWFPIMARSNRRIIYLDTHAGTGRYRTGQPGSPILALQVLCEHTQLGSMVSTTEIGFYFIENSAENVSILQGEIAALGQLPRNVYYEVKCADYETELTSVFDQLEAEHKLLAPTFVFLDPFTYNVPLSLMNRILDFPKAEILLNLMAGYVDMVKTNPPLAAYLDRLFGGRTWRGVPSDLTADERRLAFAYLLEQQLHAEFFSLFTMRATNQQIKYFLLHATKHERGRQEFKNAMWRQSPDGLFTAYESTNPYQPMLLDPADPDLTPLYDLLWSQFAGRRVQYHVLLSWLLSTDYRETHLNNLLRAQCKSGAITVCGGAQRFIANRDPLLQFAAERP